jgi:hypothetical protein
MGWGGGERARTRSTCEWCAAVFSDERIITNFISIAISMTASICIPSPALSQIARGVTVLRSDEPIENIRQADRRPNAAYRQHSHSNKNNDITNEDIGYWFFFAQDGLRKHTLRRSSFFGCLKRLNHSGARSYSIVSSSVQDLGGFIVLHLKKHDISKVEVTTKKRDACLDNAMVYESAPAEDRSWRILSVME